MTTLNSRDRCLFFTHYWASVMSGKPTYSFLQDLQMKSGSAVLDSVLPRIAEAYNGDQISFVRALTRILSLPNPYLDGLRDYEGFSANPNILLKLIDFAKMEMWLDSLRKNPDNQTRIEAFSDAVRLVAGLHVLAPCAPNILIDVRTIQRFDCSPSFLATFERLGDVALEKGRFFWPDLPAWLEQTENPFLPRGTPLWWAAHFLRPIEEVGKLESDISKQYIDLAIIEFKTTKWLSKLYNDL